VADAAWARAEVARLDALRLGALEGWLAARLDLGESSSVAADAERLVDQHPYRERIWELLMLAQYRAGQQIEALRTFQRVRSTLGDELGIEPGPALVQLERAILTHDPGLTTAAPGRDTSGALPTGVVTFLLTDLVDSTRLWDTDPASMEVAIAAHDRLVASVVAEHGGALLKARGEGDSTLSVFQRATDAVNCAVAFRAAMARFAWPGERLRARMAVHTGEAVERDEDFYGPAVNRAARIRAHATAEQILVSAVAAGIVADRLRHQIDLVDLGRVQLRGITGDEHLFEVSPLHAAAAAPSGPARGREAAALACRELPMVGLDTQLAALLDAWESARSGTAQVAAVRGGCGTGKTRLAAELATAVEDAGGVVLYAGCRSEGGFAFEALAEAIARARSGVEPDPDEPFTAALAFAALAAVRDPGAGLCRWLRGDASEDRMRRLAAFVDQIRSVARGSPVALIVDDAQWLDAETQVLLVDLANTEIRLPLLVVATVEPVEPDPVEILVNAAGTEVHLPPRSGAVAGDGVPAVSSAARRVLEVVHIAGGELPVALVAAVVEPQESIENIAAACDELAAAGLVRRAGDHIAIAHHDASTAASASLDGQALVELHGRIGRALDDGASGVADTRRIARHLLLGDGERDVAADLGRHAAADAASRGLWRDAAAFARPALDATRAAGLSGTVSELELLTVLAEAEVHDASGDSTWLSMVSAAGQGLDRVDALAEVAASRAERLVSGERAVDLIDLCRETLQLSDATVDPSSHIRLKAALALALSADGEPDAVTEGRSALELARRVGDKHLVHLALAACRDATAGSWDTVARRRLADEMETLTVGRAGHADALLCRSEVRLVGGDVSGAVADLEAAAAELGDRAPRSASMLVATAAAALRAGDFAAAESAVEAPTGAEDAASRSDLASATLIIRSWLAHERGALASEGSMPDTTSALPNPMAEALYTLRAADDRDLAAISANLDRLAGISETTAQSGTLKMLVQVAAALAVASAERTTDATALYEEMRAGSGRVAVTLGSLCLGPCDYYLGLLADVLGRPAVSLRHQRQALDLCERTGMIPAAVRCRIALTEVLLRRRAPGDVAEARRLAGEAYADAEQLGMTALLDVARVLLTEAGGVTDAGAWPLTRESEPNLLPPELTDLVGRDDLVAELVAQVKADRMVTLWGPGGIGKTRLALRVARDVFAAFPDGVRFVDLAETAVGGSVAEAVLAAVQGQRRGEEKSSDAVIRTLAPARMLVVLDSCEHLLGETRELASAMLGHAPDVHVVATSRETLAIAGERVVVVPPLEVPAEQVTDVAAVLSSTAVQLFIERAAAASGGFAADASNARQIAAICRYAGGLPLAVELAAGRLDVESLGELVTRVETAGSIDGLAAHGPATGRAASLTASFEWSYELLDPEAQALLRAVAVFAAPFSRDMALALHPRDDVTVIDSAFDRLVRASLVNRTSGQDARFRMLEPARQFARARSDAEELQRLRSRHAAVMLTRAERFGPQIRTADEIAATEVLLADLADHRAAINWLIDEADPRAAQMLVALYQFCHFQMVPDATQWAEVIGRQLPADHPLAPDVSGAAALGAWLEGRMPDAIELGEQSLLLAGKGGTQPPFWGLLALVDAYGYTGALERMSEVFALLVNAARRDPDPFWRINGIGYESMALLMLGRSDRARTRAEEALAQAREVGNPDCLQWSLYSLGRAWAASDDRLAAAAFDEAIAVTRPVDSRWGRCINLIEWAGAERRLGEFDAAAAGLLELLQLLTANGHRSLLSQALREVAYVLHASGDDDTAAVALLAREGLPDQPVIGEAMEEPLTEILRDASGDSWDRLRLRARSLPEADLVRLCRERLEGTP
jgi:predicted ATPase/class 3 adenylate cyclase